MHRAEMMSITSQATARVWVICTVPKMGTFSKVARILAPLIDTYIKHNHLIINELLNFEWAKVVLFRFPVIRHGLRGGVAFGEQLVPALQKENHHVGEQNRGGSRYKVDGL